MGWLGHRAKPGLVWSRQEFETRSGVWNPRGQQGKYRKFVCLAFTSLCPPLSCLVGTEARLTQRTTRASTVAEFMKNMDLPSPGAEPLSLNPGFRRQVIWEGQNLVSRSTLLTPLQCSAGGKHVLSVRGTFPCVQRRLTVTVRE